MITLCRYVQVWDLTLLRSAAEKRREIQLLKTIQTNKLSQIINLNKLSNSNSPSNPDNSCNPDEIESSMLVSSHTDKTDVKVPSFSDPSPPPISDPFSSPSSLSLSAEGLIKDNYPSNPGNPSNPVLSPSSPSSPTVSSPSSLTSADPSSLSSPESLIQALQQSHSNLNLELTSVLRGPVCSLSTAESPFWCFFAESPTQPTEPMPESPKKNRQNDLNERGRGRPCGRGERKGGKYLASGSEDGRVHIWDRHHATHSAVLKVRLCVSFCFSVSVWLFLYIYICLVSLSLSFLN